MIIMRIYGDEYVELRGSITEKDSNFYKIWLDEYKKSTYIPKNYLIERLCDEKTSQHVFLIPLWFLRNQKIIPLI